MQYPQVIQVARRETPSDSRILIVILCLVGEIFGHFAPLQVPYSRVLGELET